MHTCKCIEYGNSKRNYAFCDAVFSIQSYFSWSSHVCVSYHKFLLWCCEQKENLVWGFDSYLIGFRFFVTTNSIVCGYLVLSLVLSFFNIVRTIAMKSRILLVFLDTVNTLILLWFSSDSCILQHCISEMVKDSSNMWLITFTKVKLNLWRLCLVLLQVRLQQQQP